MLSTCLVASIYKQLSGLISMLTTSCSYFLWCTGQMDNVNYQYNNLCHRNILIDGYHLNNSQT